MFCHISQNSLYITCYDIRSCHNITQVTKSENLSLWGGVAIRCLWLIIITIWFFNEVTVSYEVSFPIKLLQCFQYSGNQYPVKWVADIAVGLLPPATPTPNISVDLL